MFSFAILALSSCHSNATNEGLFTFTPSELARRDDSIANVVSSYWKDSLKALQIAHTTATSVRPNEVKTSETASSTTPAPHWSPTALWNNLREREAAHKGEHVKWELEVVSVALKMYRLAGGSPGKYDVTIVALPDDSPRLHDEDLIEVEGEFMGITQFGAVAIAASKVRYLGIKK
jgi:hypothetical protein